MVSYMHEPCVGVNDNANPEYYPTERKEKRCERQETSKICLLSQEHSDVFANHAIEFNQIPEKRGCGRVERMSAGELCIGTTRDTYEER
jgi:hypothetical protein